MHAKAWLLLTMLLPALVACGGTDSEKVASPLSTAQAVIEVSPTVAPTIEPPTPERVAPTAEAPAVAPSIEPPALAPTATPRPLPTPARVVQVAVPVVVAAAPAPPPVPDAANAPSPGETGPIFITLSLANQSFTPHQIHGNAGQLVVATLTGATEAHTFTIPTLGVDTTIRAGEAKTVEFTVRVDGITSFYCRTHGSANAGMHGLLVFH